MKFKYTLLLLPILFASCSESTDKPLSDKAGGTFSMTIDNEPSTFIAREITDVYSQEVLSQVMEGLVNFNPEDLTIQPLLAKSWKVSPDGTKYAFQLRTDVLFHPNAVFSSDEERLLTAEDVKFTVEKACKPNEKGLETLAYSQVFLGMLKGAEEFYSGKAASISGISTGKNEITFTLTQPDPAFLSKMAQITTAIVSKKVVEAGKETDMIGTGPFLFTKGGKEGSIVLVKNPEYYATDKEGKALPYLDSVVFIVEPRKLEQLELFEQGKSLMIETLPTSRITQMLEGRIKDFNSEPPLMVLYNNPLLFTNYYFFNMTEQRFADPRVRQAFNLAIDRNKITQEVLRGQAYENGIYGIVPPIAATFKGYDFKAIRNVGYDYDPEKARKLLADAGFPGGKDFGAVNLRLNIGDIHSAVAEEISEQIQQNLGINVNIDGSTFEQKDEDADYAKGDLFRTGWSADYPSPETFLMNFYGKFVPVSTDVPSQINQSRYVNPAFDALMDRARVARSQKERYQLYNQAEIALMKNPPLMVLWYSGDIQLIYSKVRNLKNNPMGLIDLREVWLKDWTKEEWMKHRAH